MSSVSVSGQVTAVANCIPTVTEPENVGVIGHKIDFEFTEPHPVDDRVVLRLRKPFFTELHLQLRPIRISGKVDNTVRIVGCPHVFQGNFIGDEKGGRQPPANTSRSRKWLPSASAGAANRTRTCDPVITNDVLYQLSYCGGPNSALRNYLKTRAPDIGQRLILQEKRACPKPSQAGILLRKCFNCPSGTENRATRRPGPAAD
jgi:hypothetical protein